MKCIKSLLFLMILCKICDLPAMSKHIIMLFIKDANTQQVVYDIPVQATYGGNFISSNHNGQIILPRKTQVSEFSVVITPQIIPVFSILNNISHLQIPINQAASIYHIKLEVNSKNNLPEWRIKQTTIPADRTIPLHTIVILAQPANFTMQTGVSAVLPSNQLILPSIYLHKPLLDTNLAVTLPNSRPFLSKIETAYTLTPYGYATIQTK